MNASQLRPISYGEAQDRQVRPGKIGLEGPDNRRIALAVDYSGTPASPAAMPQQPMTPDQSQPPPTGQPAPPPDSQPDAATDRSAVVATDRANEHAVAHSDAATTSLTAAM